MMIRLVLLGLTCSTLLACQNGGQGFGQGTQINSGSYDWTISGRDASAASRSPGWGDVIQGGGGSSGSMQ